jgi:hypothetical protein
MRVIDEDRRALAAADEFETAGRAFELFERREDRARGASRGNAKTGGDKRVRRLKRTGKRKKEREGLLSMGNFDPRRKILGFAFEEAQRRALSRSRRRAVAPQPRRPCRYIAAGIDNGGLAWGKRRRTIAISRRDSLPSACDSQVVARGIVKAPALRRTPSSRRCECRGGGLRARWVTRRALSVQDFVQGHRVRRGQRARDAPKARRRRGAASGLAPSAAV